MKRKKTLTIEKHIKELRNRLLLCIIFFIVSFVVCFHFSRQILSNVLLIGKNISPGYQLAYLYPQELFLQYLTVSAVCAIAITFPVVLLEIVIYVFPALKLKEKISASVYLIAGISLFGLGLYFGLKVMIPFILKYFSDLNQSSGLQSSISVEKYVSLIQELLISFAGVFEIPIISVILTKIGILTPERMKVIRPVVIIVIFIIAAIITPPDVVSQCMIGIPMTLLYELSIVLSKIIVKRR